MNQNNLITTTSSRPMPRQLAYLIGEWVKAALIIVAWLVALSTVLAIGYICLRVLLAAILFGHSVLGV